MLRIRTLGAVMVLLAGAAPASASECHPPTEVLTLYLESVVVDGEPSDDTSAYRPYDVELTREAGGASVTAWNRDRDEGVLQLVFQEAYDVQPAPGE